MAPVSADARLKQLARDTADDIALRIPQLSYMEAMPSVTAWAALVEVRMQMYGDERAREAVEAACALVCHFCGPLSTYEPAAWLYGDYLHLRPGASVSCAAGAIRRTLLSAEGGK